MLDIDRRHIGLNLGLARRYELDIRSVQQRVSLVGLGQPLEDLREMQNARNTLLNILYAAPDLTEPRSKLIEASAGITACDAALCRLHDKGKIELSHELGRRVLPLTQELAQLRLRLRRGQGGEIRGQCEDVARRTLELLAEIRATLR